VRRISALIIAILLLASTLSAQTVSDSIERSSFRKGRNLVGMSGSISSSNIASANTSADNSQLGNLYRFDVRLGKFVANKHMLGLLFSASRTQMVGYVNARAEFLGIGPWYRLYLGKDPHIAFYIQTDILYSDYYGESIGTRALFTVDENLELDGVRASLGIGLSYVVGDRVSFDVGFEYNQARYWGVIRDNVFDSKQDVVLDRGGFVFSFGFNVLFKRLKQDG
jgi:hypothetical protein